MWLPVRSLSPGKERDIQLEDTKDRAMTVEVTHTVNTLFADAHRGALPSSAGGAWGCGGGPAKWHGKSVSWRVAGHTKCAQYAKAIAPRVDLTGRSHGPFLGRADNFKVSRS